MSTLPFCGHLDLLPSCLLAVIAAAMGGKHKPEMGCPTSPAADKEQVRCRRPGPHAAERMEDAIQSLSGRISGKGLQRGHCLQKHHYMSR